MTGRWGGPRTATAGWKKLRRTVLDRDRGICHLCGQAGADTVDHVKPVSLGGTDNLDNLAAAHDDPCHRRKTSAEGVAARAKHSAARLRPVEPHPGLRRPPKAS